MTLLGKQFVMLLERCSSEFITNPDLVIDSVTSVATTCGLNIIEICEHRFKPEGLTFILLLSQSHLAVHTWPEHRIMTVDLFVCQESFDIESFLNRLLGISGALCANKVCVFEK